MSDLRTLLVRIWRGQANVSELQWMLMDARVLVVSGQVHDDEFNGFQPVLETRSGVSHVAVFTGETAYQPFCDRAPYGGDRKLRDLINYIDARHGLIIDPGLPHETCLSPDAVAALRAGL